MMGWKRRRRAENSVRLATHHTDGGGTLMRQKALQRRWWRYQVPDQLPGTVKCYQVLILRATKARWPI